MGASGPYRSRLQLRREAVSTAYLTLAAHSRGVCGTHARRHNRRSQHRARTRLSGETALAYGLSGHLPTPQSQLCRLQRNVRPSSLTSLLRNIGSRQGSETLRSAERVGFEPTVASRPQRFSRAPRSTTPAPLHIQLTKDVRPLRAVDRAGGGRSLAAGRLPRPPEGPR
jgi:hypothetical protein